MDLATNLAPLKKKVRASGEQARSKQSPGARSYNQLQKEEDVDAGGEKKPNGGTEKGPKEKTPRNVIWRGLGKKGPSGQTRVGQNEFPEELCKLGTTGAPFLYNFRKRDHASPVTT